MPSPLDSRQLRAFHILARTGSFTEAARELHLTQSAVSHAIRSLEEDVGCRLLDRTGKKATLTQSGEQLLQRTDRILSEMELAREELKRLGKWGASRLRLTATHTPALGRGSFGRIRPADRRGSVPRRPTRGRLPNDELRVEHASERQRPRPSDLLGQRHRRAPSELALRHAHRR